MVAHVRFGDAYRTLSLLEHELKHWPNCAIVLGKKVFWTFRLGDAHDLILHGSKTYNERSKTYEFFVHWMVLNGTERYACTNQLQQDEKKHDKY